MERVYTAPRLDKLGVKPGSRVALVGLDDDDFEAELRDRTADVTHGDPAPDTDLVFLAADDHDDARDPARPARATQAQRRDLGRVPQGQGRDAARRRGHGGGEGERASSTTRS